MRCFFRLVFGFVKSLASSVVYKFIENHKLKDLSVYSFVFARGKAWFMICTSYSQIPKC